MGGRLSESHFNYFNFLFILIADQMDRRESINSSVNQDVEGIFISKTYSQLVQLHKQINQKIASGDAVDIGSYRFIYMYSPFKKSCLNVQLQYM